jgi:uncharacterized protein
MRQVLPSPAASGDIGVMRTRDADILIIPGLGGSGPDHWQSRWQAKLPTARRVEQASWDVPNKDAWVGRIAEAIAESERPVVLVAHSLGVIAATHALSKADPSRVSGAFLVAAPEEDRLRDIPAVDPGFIPYVDAQLACPAVLVSSTGDPYSSEVAAARLAATWGARLVDAGPQGHINSASGHGPWPEGLMTFAGFIAKLDTP